MWEGRWDIRSGAQHPGHAGNCSLKVKRRLPGLETHVEMALIVTRSPGRGSRAGPRLYSVSGCASRVSAQEALQFL